MKTIHALKHILVVEPDIIQARVMREYLQNESLSIQAVATAQEAIAAADVQLPDVVIMELALPAHNGIEFLHEFRSYAEWSDIPVLVFSLQHVHDSSVLGSLGRVSYLYKPQTSLAELKQQVLDALA